MHNTVDFFRFCDHYEDVFIEDDHYLYACAEPFGWAHMLVCNEYNDLEDSGWMRGDTSGADAEYLMTLEPAPVEIALEVIRIETRRELHYWLEAHEMHVDDEEFEYLLDEQMENVKSWIED